jgi:hypothetical protein
MASFTRKVQNTPKVRSIRRKIAAHKKVAKKLSNEYKRAISSEAKRLSRKTKRSRKKSR